MASFARCNFNQVLPICSFLFRAHACPILYHIFSFNGISLKSSIFFSFSFFYIFESISRLNPSFLKFQYFYILIFLTLPCQTYMPSTFTSSHFLLTNTEPCLVRTFTYLHLPETQLSCFTAIELSRLLFIIFHRKLLCLDFFSFSYSVPY